MIEISKELQELYATDGVAKKLKIYIIGTDTILSNEEISSESFTLTEILSDEEQITYGLCNSSKVEFTTIGDNAISEGTVLRLAILIGNDLTELLLGTYIVDSAKKQTNKQLKNIIAYDRLYNIDNTDMIYFYDKTIFPLTLKQLRDNFFNYVGITCEDTTLLNDNLTVNEYNDFRNLSAREFLTQICELNAVFGKISRNDTFIFFDITQSSSVSFTDYPIRTVETENFETKKINRIKVIEGGGAVLYNIGEGNEETNYYNIKDNFLLTGRAADDETLQSTIDTLYTKINSLYYTPCTITAKGLPYLETGDLIQINKDNQTIRTYILSRTLKGTIALTDNFSANGVNTLREVYSAEESISQNVYNNYQSNRLNYITSQNGERIILPTERTNAISQTFGNTDDLSNFEYMAVITATIEVGGNIQFEYRVDGETLDIKPIQSAYSPTNSISTYAEDDSANVTYQQIVLYLPQTNSAIGTHTFEVDVISDATGYIDRNHWVSCWKGQNISMTDKAVVSITIIDLPNKLAYSKDEELDLTGLVVCANYVGGAKKILSSNEYTVTADTSIVGTQSVLITYALNSKLTATFNIDVVISIDEHLSSNFVNDLVRFYNVNYKQYVSFAEIIWFHKKENEESYTQTHITYYQDNIISVETELHVYKTPSGQMAGLEIMGNCPTKNYPVIVKFKSPFTNKILEYQFTVSCYSAVVVNLLIDVARTQNNKMTAYFTKKYLTSTTKVGENISIFWNDGSDESYLTYSNTTATHTYADSVQSTRIVLAGSLEYLKRNFIGKEISVTNMIISNKITKIYDYACAGFDITSISLPDTLTIISSYAFTQCKKLTSITIPDSVTTIGERAFELCTSLKFISVPVTLQGQSFVEETTDEIHCRGSISQWIANGKQWYFHYGKDGNHKILCDDGYITHTGDYIDPGDHETIISGLHYNYY